MRDVFFDDKTSNTLLWLNIGHARKEKGGAVTTAHSQQRLQRPLISMLSA